MNKNLLMQDVDAGILCFKSCHPRWCYAQLGDDGFVYSCTEKKVVSTNALAGFYYFKNKDIYDLFIDFQK